MLAELTIKLDSLNHRHNQFWSFHHYHDSNRKFAIFAYSIDIVCEQLRSILAKKYEKKSGNFKISWISFFSIFFPSLVDERKRIHRSCGFYEPKSEKLVCNEKTGSAGYSTITCACRGEFCNHATARLSSSALFQVLWPALLLLWVAQKARNQV